VFTMGKKDNKKKGKGAEKTAAKTQKKTAQKVKKTLQAKGEMDLDTMLAKIEEDAKNQTEIVEIKLKEPPSKRSSFTLTPHPEKDQLIMFGGEFFNGNQAFVYNDLFIYTPKQDRWHQVKSRGPAPRSGHQAVSVPSAGGQLWVFGGEFTNQTETQFHHYKDFWMFSLASKQWQKIGVAGAPSSRSGHRMVVCKRKIYVFGGFHDYDDGNFKYFNDVHCFDLDKFTWTKLAPTGVAPAPRSACGLAALSDGRVLVYGGYSKTKDKAGKEKGATLSDMFLLVPDKHDDTGLKCKWVKVTQGGDKPEPPRCSFAFTACNPVPGLSGWGEDKAVLFGGVTDREDGDDDDSDVETNGIHGDMWLLDLATQRWTELLVTGKRAEARKARRRNKDKDGDGEGGDSSEEDEDMAEDLEALAVEPQETVAECGAFTITQSSGGSSSAPAGGSAAAVGAALAAARGAVFSPPPRMSAAATARGGRLYVWGGRYEAAGKELTLNDCYSLDLSKLEEWHIIQALNPKDLEWFDSESEDESEDDSDEEMDSS